MDRGATTRVRRDLHIGRCRQGAKRLIAEPFDIWSDQLKRMDGEYKSPCLPFGNPHNYLLTKDLQSPSFSLDTVFCQT